MFQSLVLIGAILGIVGLTWRLGRFVAGGAAVRPASRVRAIVVASGFAGLLLAVLTVAVMRGQVVALDAAVEPIYVWLHATPAIHVIVWVTRIGDSAALTAVVAIASGFLLAGRARREAAGLWCGFLALEASTWLLKFVVDQPRPGLSGTVETVISPGYPSAHAGGSLIVYGLVAWCLIRRTDSNSHRFALTYLAAVAVGLVALSRIVLSVHTLSEVVAGLLLAIVWLGATIAVVGDRSRKRSNGGAF